MSMLMRSDVINEIIALFDEPDYLEIGVWRGDTFREIKTASKTAVDPQFMFDYETMNAENNGSVYYQKTSNSFFAKMPSEDNKFDVIFLDGLHTFEQTLIDLLHSIERLRNGGIIIVDDVIPDSYPASLRSQQDSFQFRQIMGDPSQAWMGDVYRLVFFINSFMLNWTYFTVEENHGQLVMWRAPRIGGNQTDELVSSVGNKSYLDSVVSRDIFNVQPLAQIVELARDRSR